MPQYHEPLGQLVIDEGMHVAANGLGCIVQGLRPWTIVAGILLAIGGAMAASSSSTGSYYHASSFHRFDSSYAPGATANALEHLADRSFQNQGATWFLSGVALLILASIWTVQRQLDALLQRLPQSPQPPPI